MSNGTEWRLRARPVLAALVLLSIILLIAHLSDSSLEAQISSTETPTVQTVTPTPVPESTVPPGTRPNIVVVMTDDERTDDMAVMPKVKALLGANGVTFSNSFVSYPLCCPSRTTYLTGQYTHNNGVWADLPHREGYQEFEHQDTTFPVALQQDGYTTFHVGKYLNGYGKVDPSKIPPGWTEWHGSVDPQTYHYYGFRLNNNGTLHTYPKEPQYYSTDYYTTLATDFIKKQAGTGKPFFVNVAYLAPHSGSGDDDIPGLNSPPAGKQERNYCMFSQLKKEIKAAVRPMPRACNHADIRRPVTDGYAVPAPQYANTFADRPLPDPPSFNEKDVSDKPSFFRTTKDYPLITKSEIGVITTAYRDRLESLQSVDDGVEKIVNTLKETGQLDNTVFIFTSDNGWYQGEHRIPFGKYWPYEEGIRVPLIIDGPGVPKGVVRSSPVVNVDLAPTILAFAHAHALRKQDGRSLIPIMDDPDHTWQRYILLEGKTTDAVAYEGIRTARYVYIKYATGDIELYDLKTDPYEDHSLQDDPKYARIEKLLQRNLTALETCSGNSCWATKNLGKLGKW